MVALAPGQVDIWTIDLAAAGDRVQQDRRLLSADEIGRADRFHFERDRSRFTVARAAVRQILSRYAGIAPEDVCFSYGAKGKPELCAAADRSAIRFNLSHSCDRALLAVTSASNIGVDIEWVNADSSTHGIAERFFSPAETRTLLALPEECRTDAFFACWTRKEAYVKALGEGLAVPLDSFVVAFDPGGPAALVDVHDDVAETTRWSMYNLEAPDGYKAALVVEGRHHRLRRLTWAKDHY